MSSFPRTIAACMASAYIATGAVLGSLMYYSVPALNAAGWAYYAVTWPIFICYGTKTCKGTPYIPRWVFTFPPQVDQKQSAYK